MVAGTNPSPKVILHGFVLVTMRVLNSYEIFIVTVLFFKNGLELPGVFF